MQEGECQICRNVYASKQKPWYEASVRMIKESNR